MSTKTSVSYSLTLTVKISLAPGSLGQLTGLISQLGADMGGIDVVSVAADHKVRSIVINTRD